MSVRTCRIEENETAAQQPRQNPAYKTAPQFTGQEVLVRIKEAARIAGKSERTIMQWASNGMLTRRTEKSGARVFIRTEIEAIINQMPHSGRKKVLLSEEENNAGYMTMAEVVAAYADRASHATWYNWVRNGLLVTINRPNSSILLTKKVYVFRALQAQNKLKPEEEEELTSLEVKLMREQRKAKK